VAYDHPYWSWVVHTWSTLDAIIDGRLAEAEALAFSALAIQPDHPEAVACFGVNLVDIRLYQGNPDEMLDLLESAADANPHIPAYRAVLAMCCVEAGKPDRGMPAYRSFAGSGFAAIPADTNRLLSLVVLAHTAAQLGTVAERQALAGRLQPWSGQQAILNCFAGGGAYWGPVDHSLALLLAPGPERDLLLDRAIASARRFEAPLAVERIARDR
jgi:hypothetical protein